MARLAYPSSMNRMMMMMMMMEKECTSTDLRRRHAQGVIPWETSS